ncbi:probable E3 ubiquitin-protein ligase synoviolin at N-terminal half [Coccomyxa sp. Obi]|nr:probable E3 ubiquitin-protein ligase synoviolin at N-terminal half [Coccomyxa sp. Obi]
MMSVTKYIGLSTVAALGVVYHAFSTREQFFPSVYYLSTSKISIAVLGNFGFAFALCVYYLLIKVFLGTLREAEVERINNRISQAIMETCLAMTIFREEFNVNFVAMFTILTFIKVFHWLVQDRVDYIETTPTVSRLSHARILIFMGILLSVDSAFLQYLIGKTLAKSASVHLLFAFEYIIQASAIVSTFLKYVLSMIDNHMEGRWEHKGVYVFYLELVTDMLHLLVYLVFFVIVFTNYGLPLHLVRDLYWTFRNFRNRVADFLRYRRVTANMDERFADATAEDLARCDGICIICREDLSPGARNKKLPCNHVFHMHCLRSWLERQQNCPTCRASVFAPEPGAQPQGQGPAAAAAGAADPGARANGVDAAGDAGVFGPAPGQEGNVAAALRQRRPQPAGRQGGAPPAAATAAAAAAGGSGSRPGARGPDGRRLPRGVASPGQPGVGQAMPQPMQAQAYPIAYPGGNYGYVWNLPQWAPATSMALFVPGMHGHMQYAGQQAPDSAIPAGSQGLALPVLPMVLPPAIQALMHSAPNSTPEQQAHQAAAAAAAAAAVMSSPYSAMMLPPSILPIGMHPGGPAGAVGSAPMSQEATAAAAANAAAAAAAAVLHRGGAQASVETMEQVLMQQRDLVDAQIERLHAHMEQQSSSAAPDAAPSASSVPSGPPLNGLNNGTSSGGGTAPNGLANGAGEAAAVPGPSAPPSGVKAVAPEQGSTSGPAGAAGSGAAVAAADAQISSQVETSDQPETTASSSAEPLSEAERVRQRRLRHFGA